MVRDSSNPPPLVSSCSSRHKHITPDVTIFPVTTTLSLEQKEIFDELRLIDAGRQRIADKRVWLVDEKAKLQTVENELLIMEKDLAARDRELQGQLQKLIINGELAPISLVFDKDVRTLRWDGGSVKLGTKPFKIVRVLYHAPHRRAKLMSLAERVWGISSKPHSTVKSTISRLNAELKKAKCPYKVGSIKCLQPVIYQRDPENKVKDGMKQPDITGFKLVIRR
jgi:hypothetical protein